MSNPKITTEYSNTQLTLPLEVKEENSIKKDKLPPKFKPYNNKQSFFIHNLEELIPEHHVARVVDDMIESIPMNSFLCIIQVVVAHRFIRK